MSQSVKTKSKILESAIKIFSEKGYFKTKVSDIVANANLSQGTFYNYFTNKDECFMEILKSLNNETIEKMNKIIDENQSLEIIFYLTEILFEKLFENKLITKIFIFEARSSSNKFQELFYEFKNGLNDLFKGVIEKKYGKIKNVDTKMLIFNGAIHEIIEIHLLYNNEDLDTILKILKSCINEIFGEIYA